MKLSNLYIGDVFLHSGIYYVITALETVLIGVPDVTNIVFYIKYYRLNSTSFLVPPFFSVNVLIDNYQKNTMPHPLDKGDFEKIPHEDIPLLINLPNKTIWFEKVLNNDIENNGQNLYTKMKEVLIEKGLDK